ncbi:MAG: 30S ribosomal protein S4 [Candidatus Uhrbacteria bacterium GW2011_GWF2_41_16]|uniref:Small ribosomal subunit protein uS4 n=2 Tax=Candidatus Uhriibacteriota TaxID=1752732 RepID=A0A0G0YAA3_9BACT|nr:MAG: 30S ribosomal protein S4 [Candidatus Uhrbacteria bacterium GW2011_GWA2_41_10]KKR86085.1 MAG: 30S ribosomal protein S4 [Candidatus Uhrbacteria bacterium GW2011_GWC2_41_11]KKR97217.1 MAG: 30S ribosomal protein S4 [Candidatus Uhrbacteria bacterium GW2011_GWF2_41_16]
MTTCKMCRREGVSLCGKEKCAVKRRNYIPGVHGNTKKQPRLSSYGTQLREKQKAKRLYNIMERQFRRYFDMARAKKGNTANMLVQVLEQRLDNVIYRLGFGMTRRQARQMVNHGFFAVNGKKVDIPSFQVRIGDEISIQESKRERPMVKEVEQRLTKAQPAKWLHLDAQNLKGKVVSIPEGEDLQTVFDPTLIVELYSR